MCAGQVSPASDSAGLPSTLDVPLLAPRGRRSGLAGKPGPCRDAAEVGDEREAEKCDNVGKLGRECPVVRAEDRSIPTSTVAREHVDKAVSRVSNGPDEL